LLQTLPVYQAAAMHSAVHSSGHGQYGGTQALAHAIELPQLM